jgi:hypothetical protein
MRGGWAITIRGAGFGSHPHCAWPVCDRGSRALAMATRQSCCEFEIVPSLHLNLCGSSTIGASLPRPRLAEAQAPPTSASQRRSHRIRAQSRKQRLTAPARPPARSGGASFENTAAWCDSMFLFHRRKLHWRVWTFNEVDSSHLSRRRRNCYDIFRNARAKRSYMKKRQAAKALTMGARGFGSRVLAKSSTCGSPIES